MGTVATKRKPQVQRRATISDVAEAAGVSRTTVSLVLADHPRITQPTKDLVRKTLSDLGYVYNRAARAVRSGTSSLLGLLVTDIRNPFFAELTMAVDHAVEASATSTVLGFSFGDPEREARLALSLVENLPGGIILLPTPDSTADGLSCLSGPLPLVQLLREVPGLTSDYVGVDNLASGRLLGTHLAARNLRNVVFVGGEHRSKQYDDRLAGLSEALGLPVAPVMGGPLGLRDALVTTKPDAVVTYNDTHLLSTLNALRDAGLHPGHDVAVASFDDTPLSAEVSPAVTSVNHHAAELADHAVRLLLERIADPGRELQRVTVPGTLTVRASTRD